MLGQLDFNLLFFTVFITIKCSRMCQRQPGEPSARHGDSPHLWRPFCQPGDIRERLDTFLVFIVEGVGDAVVSSGWKSGMLPVCYNP